MTRAELAAGLGLPLPCLDDLTAIALDALGRLHRAGVGVACTEPTPGYRLFHFHDHRQDVTCTGGGLAYLR